MKRDWTNPWTNPVGELLYPVLAFALRFAPKVYDSPKPVVEDQPEPGCQWIRWCVDCKAHTMHHEYHWRDVNETTIECDYCGGVWVTG